MGDYAFLLDAPDAAAARLQIATLGDYEDGRYGSFAITRDDVDSWRNNLSKLPGGRALIDLDHSADRSPRKTEAAGWITGIGWDGDTPMADVEWTPIGRQAIEDKRYLFFSPTYGDHKDEHGNVHKDTLVGGALTNKPFLTGMPTLTLASEERVSAGWESEYATLDVGMAERKTAVKEGNALPDGSYPIRNVGQLHAAITLAKSGHGDVAGAKKLIKRRAAELGATDVLQGMWPNMSAKPVKQADSRSHIMNPELLKTLSLADDADASAVLEAVKALQTKPEPTEVKSLEAQAAEAGMVVLDADKYRALETGANAGIAAQKELASQRFEVAFDDALRNGRAVPAQKEQRAHFYTLDAEATLKELAEGPVLVNVKPQGWDNTHLQGGGDAPEGVHAGSHTENQRILEVQAKNPGMDYMAAFDHLRKLEGAA